jgi:dihydrofolate reductase
MGRLVLQVSAMSLDGCITADGTPAESLVDVADPVRDAWIGSRLRTAAVHIMGRVTYESMLARSRSPTQNVAPMHRIPRVVFSRTLTEARSPATTIAAGDLACEVERLKKVCAGDVVAHGGIAFDQSIAASGLVDEYRLVVHPYAAGWGAALFDGLDKPTGLELVSATAFPTGSIGLEYRPRG